MTILEAINQVDNLKYNTYTQGDKIAWLSRLDGMAKRLIIDTHDGAEAGDFSGYNDKTSLDTQLLIPSPFDSVYIRWLETMIDYANGEYDKYNNSMLMFHAEYDSYADFYKRTHMPKGKGTRFIF